MNKIRKYLIHLLGGVTRDELQQDVYYYSKAERADVTQQLKWKMEDCYGQSAEEWCKNMYEYICERHEQAFKNFNEYAESINYSKNILGKKFKHG